MASKQKKILFYYLSAFSHTGGIEKFNRCFIKAMDELPEGEFSGSVVSVYDAGSDDRYNTRSFFKGFHRKRGKSVAYIVRQAFRYDVLVLGHINLAIAGVLVKMIRPQCKVVLIAHGIEVWDRLYFIKKLCLRKADLILSVSNYTKNQLVLRNGISPDKIRLFPNTIDPFFRVPQQFHKPSYLLERYKLGITQPIILTLSRLSSSEQYKGYDKVIAALPTILKEVPDAVYVLAGKYDETERKRIEDLVILNGVSNHVLLTGYIEESEVADHYRLADVFIMPSRKEGFGIVFLEALACGTAVIGGNQDGTVDALLNGSLGELINPTKINEIADAILLQLKQTTEQSQGFQDRVLHQYRFLKYKERLQKYLAE